jgi:hypothetical protein
MKLSKDTKQRQLQVPKKAIAAAMTIFLNHLNGFIALI